MSKDSETSAVEFARRKEEIEEKKDTCISRLNDLFAKIDERRRVCISLAVTFLRKIL